MRLFLVAVAVLAGCTAERGESSTSDTTAAAVPVSDVTIPPDRRTPFCAIMIALDLDLPDDPAVDVTDQVLDAYRRALPVAPPEISVELEAVIVGLETGTDPTLPDEPATTTTTGPAITTTSTTTTDDGSPATTLNDDLNGGDFAEEGYLPDDAPQVRLNDFVDFNCRDNVNNPGPPATPPHVEPPPTVTAP